MTKVRVDPTGAKYLLVTMLIAKLFTTEPRMLSVRAGTAAWLVVLLGGLLACGGFWLLNALLARFPGRSIAYISQAVLGKTLGRLVCVIYAAYFCYIAGMMFREFSASFRIAVLPLTPISATTLLFILLVLFTATKGFEGITRMASYLVPLLLLVWAVTIAGTLRFLEPYYLAPWFGQGVAQTLLMSVPGSSLYSEVLALGVLASALPQHHARRAGYNALLTATLLMTISLVVLEAAFPFPTLSRLAFPMMDLTRMVELSEFLQRLEALFVFQWVFVAGFTTSSLLVSAATILQEVTGLADSRPLLPALCLICYTLSFVPVNVVQLAWLVSDTIRMWGWPISFGLPTLTLAVAVLLGKRGANHDETPSPAG